MKNFFEINRALVAKKKIMMIIMAVALYALPTMAQDWQSTSTMQGSGSTYSSQVTGVGAAGVSNMATTTESYSPANAGRRKVEGVGGGEGGSGHSNPGTGDPGSPVGDALIPLLLCECMYLSVRVFLKRKRALKGE